MFCGSMIGVFYFLQKCRPYDPSSENPLLENISPSFSLYGSVNGRNGSNSKRRNGNSLSVLKSPMPILPNLLRREDAPQQSPGDAPGDPKCLLNSSTLSSNPPVFDQVQDQNPSCDSATMPRVELKQSIAIFASLLLGREESLATPQELALCAKDGSRRCPKASEHGWPETLSEVSTEVVAADVPLPQAPLPGRWSSKLSDGSVGLNILRCSLISSPEDPERSLDGDGCPSEQFRRWIKVRFSSSTVVSFCGDLAPYFLGCQCRASRPTGVQPANRLVSILKNGYCVGSDPAC
jgi:hypothetical protein